LKKWIISLLLAFSCNSTVYSAVHCGPEQVKGVIVKSDGTVLYRSKQGFFRNIGKASEEHVKLMYLSLSDIAGTKKVVTATFDNGFDCNSKTGDKVAKRLYFHTPKKDF